MLENAVTNVIYVNMFLSQDWGIFHDTEANYCHDAVQNPVIQEVRIISPI